ncbi:MAG: fumarylacetoacetase [Phycisphaerales bacterium]
MTRSAPGFSAPDDPTLSPDLRSWVESANDPATDFPIQCLPYCSFLPAQADPDDPHAQRPRIGIGIGDRVVDVDMLMHAGFFDPDDRALVERLHHAIHLPVLNALASAPHDVRSLLRRRVQEFLRDAHAGQQARRLRQKAVHAQDQCAFFSPVVFQNYTDFYASIHHARTVGSMFRPDNPLLPNYTHVPIGYHGRASSIIVSGREVRRPLGQTNIENAATPTFGPSKRLDYELEFGCVIGPGNALGSPVSIADAPRHIFGFCLVNDWSARDIQAWEYQPLGPFLAKNFATTVSPWIVPVEALAPFRVPGPERGAGDPQPLPYLRSEDPWGLDVRLEVHLQSARMREQNLPPARVSSGNLRHMFWTFPQMIAHHTVGGCNLQPGDLLASGTVSGPDPASRGCLLERTWAGTGPDGKPLPRTPLELPTGEKRTFLEDGDTVTLRGWCEREGFRRIGFGPCAGTITPAAAAGA